MYLVTITDVLNKTRHTFQANPTLEPAPVNKKKIITYLAIKT